MPNNILFYQLMYQPHESLELPVIVCVLLLYCGGLPIANITWLVNGIILDVDSEGSVTMWPWHQWCLFTVFPSAVVLVHSVL